MIAVRQFEWLVVIVAVGACGAQPSPVGGDANGPSAGDAAAVTCTRWGQMFLYVPVADADSLTSPWISDDGQNLWYTLWPGGTEPVALVHATLVGDRWSGTLITPGPTRPDHPFVTEDGRTLFFDGGSGPMIYEMPVRGGALILHDELGPAEDPALSPDGTTIYFRPVGTHYIAGANRATSAGVFGPPALILEREASDLRSPSVTRDGATLFYSADGPAGMQFLSSSLSDPFGSAEVVLDAGFTDFAPKVASDGLTLVLAGATLSWGGGPSGSRLWKATRTCH